MAPPRTPPKQPGIVNIRGKQYRTVALRVTLFRGDHPVKDGWGILTETVKDEDGIVICKAEIIDPERRVVAREFAEEKRGSSMINKTSALENCLTSAIGRALAACGYAGEEYASADEVAGAISQQSTLSQQNPPARGNSSSQRPAQQRNRQPARPATSPGPMTHDHFDAELKKLKIDSLDTFEEWYVFETSRQDGEFKFRYLPPFIRDAARKGQAGTPKTFGASRQVAVLNWLRGKSINRAEALPFINSFTNNNEG
jgi:hypothetical protein